VGAATGGTDVIYAEVGLGDLLWTAIWVFFLTMFIWVFIAVVSDLFRDHELSGVAKAIWLVGLVVFPLLGPLAYMIVRGRGMAERAAAQQRMANEQLAGYIRATASETGDGPVDDLERLAGLRRNGIIDDAEFEAMKARIVAGTVPA
jgi:hypothetical protein